jgi:hypothetical protein
MVVIHACRVVISRDREGDSRRGGDTQRNEHQQSLEPHFELKLNKHFKSVTCLKGGQSYYKQKFLFATSQHYVPTVLFFAYEVLQVFCEYGIRPFSALKLLSRSF